MSITVKGQKVRTNELGYDNEISFSRLNIKGQKRLFLENKNLFLYEALSSSHEAIVNLAKEHMAECSSETLNDVLRELTTNSTGWYDSKLVLEILNIPHLQLDLNIRKNFSRTEYWAIRYWTADDKSTPKEILSDLFITEAWEFIVDNITNGIEKILQNPNFVMDEELHKKLQSRFSDKQYSKIMEKVRELTELAS